MKRQEYLLWVSITHNSENMTNFFRHFYSFHEKSSKYPSLRSSSNPHLLFITSREFGLAKPSTHTWKQQPEVKNFMKYKIKFFVYFKGRPCRLVGRTTECNNVNQDDRPESNPAPFSSRNKNGCCLSVRGCTDMPFVPRCITARLMESETMSDKVNSRGHCMYRNTDPIFLE